MVHQQTEKLHAACDECRTRKLKCSGYHPVCQRCERERIQCVYSPQKPMGRPRKKRRGYSDEKSDQQFGHAAAENLSRTPITSNLEVPVFTDLQQVLPPFDDFPGLSGFRISSSLSDAPPPPPYIESIVNNGFEQETMEDMNFDTTTIDAAIDPSRWNDQSTIPDPNISNRVDAEATTRSQHQPPPDIGPCTCLSLMFLTASDLQSITNFAFPEIIPRLRNASATAHDIIHCPKCPLQEFAAVQNVHFLVSLLSSLAERYHKVLSAIDVEAARLGATGEKKAFRVGDNSPQNMHLHTGTLDCPMGFDIELDQKVWKKICKAALKTEVVGGGHCPMPLTKLLDELERRQRRWHTNKDLESAERKSIFGAQNESRMRGATDMCLGMVHQVRKMVETMRWED